MSELSLILFQNFEDSDELTISIEELSTLDNDTTSMPTRTDIPTEPEVVLPEVVQATPIVPACELQVASDGADYYEISDQFQFQTSFQSHFIANFDKNDVGTNNIAQFQGNSNNISHELDDISSDEDWDTVNTTLFYNDLGLKITPKSK